MLVFTDIDADEYVDVVVVLDHDGSVSWVHCGVGMVNILQASREGVAGHRLHQTHSGPTVSLIRLDKFRYQLRNSGSSY